MRIPLGVMKTVGLLVIVPLASAVLAWGLMAGMCITLDSIQARAVDWVCGHNAFIPLVLFWVAGLIVLPALWAWLRRERASITPISAKCSKCGASVSLADERCPQCGFRFGPQVSA